MPRQIVNRIAIPEGLRQSRRPFFNRAQGRQFDIAAADGTAEVTLYDEIGYFGVSAADFRRQLDGIDARKILLRINSPGGDVFDGLAMHNDLIDHAAEVTVRVTGVAASAASIIAMAGDRIELAESAFLMIHNAWTIELGDKFVMADTSRLLGQIDEALAGVYARQTGRETAEIAALMDAETWLDGASAVELGFADAIAGEADAQARFDLSAFHNAPAALALEGEAKPETFRDYERLLMQDAGMSRSQARALLRNGHPGTQDAAEPGESTQDAALDADHQEAFDALIAKISAAAS